MGMHEPRAAHQCAKNGSSTRCNTRGERGLSGNIVRIRCTNERNRTSASAHPESLGQGAPARRKSSAAASANVTWFANVTSKITLTKREGRRGRLTAWVDL